MGDQQGQGGFQMLIAPDPLDQLGKQKAHRQAKGNAAEYHDNEVRQRTEYSIVTGISMQQDFEKYQKYSECSAVVEQAFALKNI